MAHDDLTPGRLTRDEAAAITRATARWSVSVAGVLCLLKAWAWRASDSVSMLSSLADSALDLAASLFTLAAVAYAARPPDAEHRYGHGKAEGLASLVQASLVGVAAAMVAIEAIPHFRDPRELQAGGLSIIVMTISIVLSIVLVIVQTRAVKKTGSVATAGDRAHYISDLGANAAVIIGIAGAAFFGMPILDPIIGILVAGWLVYTALDVARRGLNELLDRELDDAARAEIIREVSAVPGIIGVHMLRTRASGPSIHIQLHVDLPPHITLREAHSHIVTAERRLLERYPGADILIHPDPAGIAEPHGLETQV